MCIPLLSRCVFHVRINEGHRALIPNRPERWRWEDRHEVIFRDEPETLPSSPERTDTLLKFYLQIWFPPPTSLVQDHTSAPRFDPI
jgi:hypothetical protein